MGQCRREPGLESDKNQPSQIPSIGVVSGQGEEPLQASTIGVFSVQDDELINAQNLPNSNAAQNVLEAPVAPHPSVRLKEYNDFFSQSKLSLLQYNSTLTFPIHEIRGFSLALI